MIRHQLSSILIYFFIVMFMLSSCEEPFVPENLQQQPQIVVEGFIEAGDGANPAYLVMTKTLPFLSNISSETLNNNYISGAKVTLSDGSKTINLTELCFKDLPPALKTEAAKILGFKVADNAFIPNVCFYADLNVAMPGQAGKTYQIEILTEGKKITASTTIPMPVSLDSLRFIPNAGANQDSFLLLTSKLADPKNQQNFYRYQVKMGDGPFITPGGGSLFDDRLFNGQNFRLNLPRPGGDGESFNITTFGLYPVGKETTVRWVNMDQSLFDFWNTLEFSINNQGPFSTYTRVKTNVKGALGVWGGLYAKNYKLIVKK
jgi:Domain of unknown function (DUF4249)